MLDSDSGSARRARARPGTGPGTRLHSPGPRRVQADAQAQAASESGPPVARPGHPRGPPARPQEDWGNRLVRRRRCGAWLGDEGWGRGKHGAGQKCL